MIALAGSFVRLGYGLVQLGLVCGDLPVRQPDGSCAEPFDAADASAGRVTFRAYLAADATKVGYDSTNQTDQLRSVDARAVVVTDAKGTKADCSWDDSSGFGPVRRPGHVEGRWARAALSLPSPFCR